MVARLPWEHTLKQIRSFHRVRFKILEWIKIMMNNVSHVEKTGSCSFILNNSTAIQLDCRCAGGLRQRDAEHLVQLGLYWTGSGRTSARADGHPDFISSVKTVNVARRPLNR